jgi:hypothetical protein
VTETELSKEELSRKEQQQLNQKQRFGTPGSLSGSSNSSNNEDLVEQEISIQTLPGKLNVRTRGDSYANNEEPSNLRELNFIKEQNRHLQEKLHQLRRQNERYYTFFHFKFDRLFKFLLKRSYRYKYAVAIEQIEHE